MQASSDVHGVIILRYWAACFIIIRCWAIVRWGNVGAIYAYRRGQGRLSAKTVHGFRSTLARPRLGGGGASCANPFVDDSGCASIKRHAFHGRVILIDHEEGFTFSSETVHQIFRPNLFQINSGNSSSASAEESMRRAEGTRCWYAQTPRKCEQRGESSEHRPPYFLPPNPPSTTITAGTSLRTREHEGRTGF